MTVSTTAEMLRIKAVLVLERNATRDYLDVVALADQLGDEGAAQALRPFDALYPTTSKIPTSRNTSTWSPASAIGTP